MVVVWMGKPVRRLTILLWSEHIHSNHLDSELIINSFRCPAQCNTVILANPRAIGDEKMAFVPLIVGGGDPNRTYRGDTFICAAAIQSFVIYIHSLLYFWLTFIKWAS
jgi:hypothetical protein